MRFPAVVLLEIFGGLLPMSAVMHALNLVPTATYFWEVAEEAVHVAATNFPEAHSLGDVTKCDEAQLDELMTRHPESIFLWLADRHAWT